MSKNRKMNLYSNRTRLSESEAVRKPPARVSDQHCEVV